MTKEYLVGIGPHEIRVSVNVGTAGTAASALFLIDFDSDPIHIPTSGHDNGSIPESLVGKAEEVRQKMLTIHTTIDFGVLPESDWPSAIHATVVKYTLSGGTGGTMTFEPEKDDQVVSDNGKIVALKKHFIFL